MFQKEYRELTEFHLYNSYYSRNQPTVVRLGDWDLKADNDGAVVQDILISNIIRHPKYEPPSKYDDIALLRLEHNAR
jgi:hypothetical protein